MSSQRWPSIRRRISASNEGLSILVEEDVQRVVVTALRENGYDVTRAVDRYGTGTLDRELLDEATDRGAVILTADRDFAALATEHEHRVVLSLYL